MHQDALSWFKKNRWLLFIINIIPFILDVLLYRLGAPLDVVFFFPVLCALTALNYYFFDKTLHFILIQFYFLVCMVCSGFASTYLYYTNISSDDMSVGIGIGGVIVASVLIIVTTAVTGIVKGISNKRSSVENTVQQTK